MRRVILSAAKDLNPSVSPPDQTISAARTLLLPWNGNSRVPVPTSPQPISRNYPFSSNNVFNRPYPARLTGNFTPFVKIATLLSFPYGSIRATRSRFTMYDR